MHRNSTHRHLVLAAVALTLLLSSFVSTSAEAGYRLPWKAGRSYSVTQNWNGSFSHTGSMHYAYDFALPERTAVYAANYGWVTHIKENGNACGGQERINDANYVVIKHFDGKSTLYLHLGFQSVYVYVNQWVNRGQFLGWSGNTGWTECNSHIHFQLQNQGGWFTQSLPIYFDEEPNIELSEDTFYRSQNQ